MACEADILKDHVEILVKLTNKRLKKTNINLICRPDGRYSIELTDKIGNYIAAIPFGGIEDVWSIIAMIFTILCYEKEE
ncbi:MAG: hypothetical protein QXT26_06025 [Thermoproteota archaeon]